MHVYEARVCIFVLLLHTYPHTHMRCMYINICICYMRDARCSSLGYYRVYMRVYVDVSVLAAVRSASARRIVVDVVVVGRGRRVNKRIHNHTAHGEGEGGTEASSCTYNTCI